MLGQFVVISFISLARAEVGRFSQPSPWSYTCDSTNTSHLVTGHVVPYKCVKVASSTASLVQSLAACKMTCDPRGTLWPAPTQETSPIFWQMSNNYNFSLFMLGDKGVSILNIEY